MTQPGVRQSFDSAEAFLISLIAKAALDMQLMNVYKSYVLVDYALVDLYKFKAQRSMVTAVKLIGWCYDQGYLNRTEAFNVKHWLYWFDDPARLDPANCFFEDFRYEI